MSRTAVRAAHVATAGAASLVACCALLLLPAALPAAAQPQPDRPEAATLSLDVVGLEGVLDPDGEVRVRVRVRNGGLVDRSDLRVLATVHRETVGRWMLQQALEDGEIGNIVHPFVADVQAVPARGSRTVELAQTTREIGLDRPDLAGVYPLRLQLLADGDVVDEVVTSLVVVPETVEAPLSVATLLPLALPPSRDAEGVVVDDGVLEALGEQGSLTRTLEALNDARRTAVTLGLDGHTLTDLADLADGFALREDGVVSAQPGDAPAAERARDALDDLARIARRPLVEVLNLPLASGDLVAMVRSGATGEAERLLTDGAGPIEALTGATPTSGVLWPPDAVDGPTLALARGRGVEHVVLSESVLATGVSGVLSPVPVRRLREGGHLMTALVPDPYLEAYLGRPRPDPPVLAAQRILAEIASVYFEAPGTAQRGMLIAPPSGTRLPGDLVAALAGPLADAPFVRTVRLTRLPHVVSDQPMPVRLDYPDSARERELPSAYTTLQAAARRSLGSLAGVLEEPGGLPTRFDGLLLQATSVHYRPEEAQPAGRDLMRAVTGTVGRLYGAVEVLDSPPITLTAVEGQLPVTVRSSAEVPLRVLVTLQTARYEVDGGATREIVLEPDATQLLTFQIRALTPGGTSPIRVVISDLDGQLDLARGTVVVRSTAFSAVAVAVTAGAAAFLLLWWLRGASRRRRAGQAPRGGDPRVEATRRPRGSVSERSKGRYGPRRPGAGARDAVPAGRVRRTNLHDDRGSAGPLKLLVVVVVLGLVLYEAGAVMVNVVQVDELAQSALRNAVQQAQSPAGRTPDAVQEAARAGLARSDRARLETAVLDAAGLTVTVSQDARTIVLHRLGPLADLATARSTKTAEAG